MLVSNYFLKQINAKCESAWREWQQDTEASRSQRHSLRQQYRDKYEKNYFHRKIFVTFILACQLLTFSALVSIIFLCFYALININTFLYSSFLHGSTEIEPSLFRLGFWLVFVFLILITVLRIYFFTIKKIKQKQKIIIGFFRADLRNLKPSKTGQLGFLKPKCSEAFLPELMKQGLNAGFGKKVMKQFIHDYEMFLKLNDEKAGYCSLDRFCRKSANN